MRRFSSSCVSLTHDLCREKGITIITVLHDVNLAARMDIICQLSSGRLGALAQ